MYTEDVIYRFEGKVNRLGDCHEWTAAKHSKRWPYGMFSISRGVAKRAHRIAWEIHHERAVPEGMVVMHSCDNPSCVNPDHLRLGTALDNHHDMTSKGRDSYATFRRYEHCADEIREKYAAGGVSMRALADEYGCGTHTIHAIIHRKHY